MFTGIIEEKGRITAINRGQKSARMTIAASKVLEGTKLGDSINTDGVCLTVTAMDDKTFTIDMMHETLTRSALGELSVGDAVNLERAMQVNDRFGGHIVSGHIDGTGVIQSISRIDIAYWVVIRAPGEILRYIVDKGSIAIDGISLTVAELKSDTFSVSLIPHTKQETTLLSKRPGTKVNLENDLVGKYVEKLLNPHQKGKIDADFLKKHGY